MKYKITFLGSVLKSFIRDKYSVIAELDVIDREDLIIKALYHGKNNLNKKYENISWDSIEIKELK